MTEPDLIHTSGRETMELTERFNLLRANVMSLRSLEGVATRVGGDSVHEFLNVLGLASTLLELFDRDGVISLHALSRAECMILAWRRGGHQEVRRVRAAQQDERK